MLGLPGVKRYYLYSKPTDMRKSFRGLSGLVNNEMSSKLHSGDGFVFINKRRTMIKILVWDRTGFVIYYKRLIRGTYELPKCNDSKEFSLTIGELMLMLEGVDLGSIKWRKRYRRKRYMPKASLWEEKSLKKETN